MAVLDMAESLKHLSHQALDSWNVSNLAIRPHDGPVELVATELSSVRTVAGAVVGPRDSGQQRSITVPSGQRHSQLGSCNRP